jgi:hypothetical protein
MYLPVWLIGVDIDFSIAEGNCNQSKRIQASAPVSRFLW